MEVGEQELVLREEVLRSNAAPEGAKKLFDVPEYSSKLVLEPLSIIVAAKPPSRRHSRIPIIWQGY